MSSNSEVGHAKNAANLQKLTEQVTAFTLYNPPVDHLKVPQLQALHSSAVAKLAEVEEKKNRQQNCHLPTSGRLPKPKANLHPHHKPAKHPGIIQGFTRSGKIPQQIHSRQLQQTHYTKSTRR